MKKRRSVEERMAECRSVGETSVMRVGSVSESWVGGEVVSTLWSGDGGSVAWSGSVGGG